MVREVVGVQREAAVAHLHDVAHRLEHLGLAVRREAHDLVLVAVVRETEELREGGVEDAERVREDDAVEDLEAVAAADGEQCRREVAEAVERENRGFLER